MAIVNPMSLAATLDAVNEALFFGQRLPKAERRLTAMWIAARQGLPGSYAGMFAPTDRDFRTGARLFTGETVSTGAGTSHILGEEACRALLLLDVPLPAARDALRLATAGLRQRLRTSDLGAFCCGKCTAALWRHLAAGGLERREVRLAAGMKVLKSRRLGDGRWRAFPFYYTVLALSEIGSAAARAELRYAAPVLDRMLGRPAKDDRLFVRRRTLAERVLATC